MGDAWGKTQGWTDRSGGRGRRRRQAVAREAHRAPDVHLALVDTRPDRGGHGCRQRTAHHVGRFERERPELAAIASPNARPLAFTEAMQKAAAPLLAAVVTDVDGTLFPFGEAPQVSDGNIKALKHALDYNVHVCLATGRMPGPWSDRIRRQLPRLGASVFVNGSLVVGRQG